MLKNKSKKIDNYLIAFNGFLIFLLLIVLIYNLFFYDYENVNLIEIEDETILKNDSIIKNETIFENETNLINITKEENKINEKINDSIKSFVESCIYNVGIDGIYLTGIKGGYYNTPNLNLKFSNFNIPYYTHQEKSYMPTIDTIEDELFNYLVDYLPFCINDFSKFSNNSVKIIDEKINGEVIIANEKVYFNISYPITIKESDNFYNLTNFFTIIDFDYEEKYNMVKEIINEQKKDFDTVPFCFIINKIYELDGIFETRVVDLNSVIFFYIFDNIEDSSQSFIYSFLTNYVWSYNSTYYIQDVKINEMPEFIINKPEVFEYQVKATGENVTFFSYNDIFTINENTGEIKFNTSKLNNGHKNFLIKARDDLGNKDYQYMRFIVNLD